VVSSNSQVSYSLSRVIGGTGTDQYFAGARPWDNDDPNKYQGRTALDHTNELSFGGSVEVKYGLHLGMIGHFFSAPPTSLTLDTGSGSTGQIFQTDVNGDGVSGDLAPGTVPGSYMHQVKGAGLNQFINTYNSTYAGTPTPAGAAVVSAGLFTAKQLTELGGVQPAIATQPTDNPTPNPAFRTFDLNATFPIKFHWLKEGVSIVPGVAIYNFFNMANYGTQSGVLLNTIDAGPLGYVNGPNSAVEENNLRVTRNSGTFDQGGPRTSEFQLTINF